MEQGLRVLQGQLDLQAEQGLRVVKDKKVKLVVLVLLVALDRLDLRVLKDKKVKWEVRALPAVLDLQDQRGLQDQPVLLGLKVKKDKRV